MWEQKDKTAVTTYNHHGRKYTEESQCKTTTLELIIPVELRQEMLRNINCVSMPCTFKI